MLKEDASLACYDFKELAEQSLESKTDWPKLIQSGNEIAGLVVFSDEPDASGENDCHTYLNEVYIKPLYRKRGLSSSIALDYFKSLEFDTGLCYLLGSYAEKYWKNLLDTNGFTYEVFREDEVRDFVHINIINRKN